MKKPIIALVLALATMCLSACAGLGRMETYPHGMADAHVRVGNRAFNIWFHRTDPSVLVQRGFGAGMGQAFASGLLLNSVNFSEPMPIWKAAASAVLNPLGCTVTDVYTLDNRSTWEAKYTCEKPIDVSAVIAAHKSEYAAGIKVDDPMAAH